MKLKLRENLFFELKIQFKNHSIYVVKLHPFSPGDGDGGQNFGDGGPGDGGFDFLVRAGDPGTGIFSLTQGLRTLFLDVENMRNFLSYP